MATALVDELIEGFDMKINLIEVMYNLVDENIANIFHAMKCRKEFLLNYRKEGTMPILTDEEADALDELLTKTTPNTNPNVQGPFIRQRDTLVILERVFC